MLKKRFFCTQIAFGIIPLLLGRSASREMRQTFSSLSKLGGTTNLIQFLFGHVKKVLLRVWRIFVNLTILDGFFVITRLKIVAANLRKMEKTRLDERYIYD